jgi:hypothetical protein
MVGHCDSGLSSQHTLRNSEHSPLRVQKQSNLFVLTLLVKGNFRFFHNLWIFSPQSATIRAIVKN